MKKAILFLSILLCSVITKAEIHSYRQMDNTVEGIKVYSPGCGLVTTIFTKGVVYQFWVYLDKDENGNTITVIHVADEGGSRDYCCKFKDGEDWYNRILPNSHIVEK